MENEEMKFLKLTKIIQGLNCDDLHVKMRIQARMVAEYTDNSYLGEKGTSIIHSVSDGEWRTTLVLETIEEIDKMLAEPTWRIAP